MALLWNTLRSWLPKTSPRVLSNPRLLEQAAAAAQHLRHRPNGDLIAANGIASANLKGDRTALTLGQFVVAVERTIGWTPFDVQLLAAAAMVRGEAVEMQTGEGKTMTAAAAAAVLALQGRRVHVATVNRYLAHRDFERFAPVLGQLGISVGLIHDGQSPADKRRAYGCQVVYGTGYEYGFDYLREQLRLMRAQTTRLGDRFRRPADESTAQPLQASLDCVLIDELDSVLLDEACVPLILSESGRTDPDDLALLAQAETAAEVLLQQRWAVVDGLRRSLQLLPAGNAWIEKSRPRGPSVRLRRPWRQYVEHAVTACALLQRDVDYLVADQKIWLIDASTGRVFADRRWNEGLQQAVEFKERIPPSQPFVGAARITRQRFFQLYQHLAGTSGTLVEAAAELRQTYAMPVSIVAPRLASQRREWPTRYFVDDPSRLQAAATEAADLSRRGRPILVGCRTIAASREVSRIFAALGLVHRVLDGTQTEDEAQIIASAGRNGTVTVATNLAGRGTDIMLDDTSRSVGGLHVIGIERHNSSRIDRQLLGRAGRQGDPGSGRFFIAADDALLQAIPSATGLFRTAVDPQGEVHLDLGPIIADCQRAHEAESRLRRREVATADMQLDDVLATLAKSE